MLIEAPAAARIDAALIPLGERAEQAATGIAADLRRAGIACEMAYRGNMKKRMQKADAAKARYAIIIGDDELARGEAGVKDLASGEQRSVPLDRLAEAVRSR
jgi:histidyl-tRNA synthetase